MVVHLESGHVFSPSTTKAKGPTTTAPCLTSSTLTFLSGDAQQGTSPQNSQELTSTTLKKALSIGYCFDIALAQEICYLTLEDLGPDCQRVLDANDDSCPDYLRLPPFATCKSDCPGGNNELYILKRSILKIFPLFSVRSFGVIGGGAVLFTASVLTGETVLPMIGLGLLIADFSLHLIIKVSLYFSTACTKTDNWFKIDE